MEAISDENKILHTKTMWKKPTKKIKAGGADANSMSGPYNTSKTAASNIIIPDSSSKINSTDPFIPIDFSPIQNTLEFPILGENTGTGRENEIDLTPMDAMHESLSRSGDHGTGLSFFSIPDSAQKVNSKDPVKNEEARSMRRLPALVLWVVSRVFRKLVCNLWHE